MLDWDGLAGNARSTGMTQLKLGLLRLALRDGSAGNARSTVSLRLCGCPRSVHQPALT
ncbi:MAG: hypothetical protein F6K04_22645 [Leptolyngbya sp. SIO4C5]|nr:hypothetical protein [Leptolyngbya sp. SIO4C5]